MPFWSCSWFALCVSYSVFHETPSSSVAVEEVFAGPVSRLVRVVVPGTEIFFNYMLGNRLQRFDSDVRRLRLRLLLNQTFGKVALVCRVPVHTPSLRDCTAKGKGFCDYVAITNRRCKRSG